MAAIEGAFSLSAASVVEDVLQQHRNRPPGLDFDARRAEEAGGQNIRLSWGRNPSSKQSDQSQWAGTGGYHGYSQGCEGHGRYAAPPQDPSMYYGGYPGYGNYQQLQQ